MKLYACCGFAANRYTHDVSCFPFTVFAISDAEALGKATEDCRKRYPAQEGWNAHQASVVAIQKHLLEYALKGEST